MRVIGVDPGTQKTGIGIVEEKNNQLIPVFFETISIKNSLGRPEKLLNIHQNILRVIDEFHPELMALEDVFYGRNLKVAIRLGEARSAAILAATLSEVSISEFSPARIKESVCGNGRAAKQQVQHMVKNLLGLQELPEEDAADALAAAICYFHSNKPVRN